MDISTTKKNGNGDESLKKKIRSKARDRISNLIRDIATLQYELNCCMSEFQEDCEHPDIIEKMVTRWGAGDNDVWTHPYRCCLVCGKTEEGWYNRYSSKLPNGKRLPDKEFAEQLDKATRERFKNHD